MKDFIEENLLEHVRIIEGHKEEIIKKASSFSVKLISAFKSENKVIFAGNGGSAADAQHLSAEFVGRFKINRPPIAALALTTDTSALTAIGNDFCFEKIFSRQIEALGKPGDVFFVISTSGNSENLVDAVRTAKEKQITVFGLLGKNGGKLKELLDEYIVISCENSPRIQEAHIMIGHIICEIVERELYG